MSLHYKLYHCGDNWPIIQRIGTKPITHDKKAKQKTIRCFMASCSMSLFLVLVAAALLDSKRGSRKNNLHCLERQGSLIFSSGMCRCALIDVHFIVAFLGSR